MAFLDHTFETVLALTWLVVTLTIGYAVLSWLYAIVFVGGSAVAVLLALVFIGFGTVIVYGSLRLYAPTVNPLEGFRRLLSYQWEDQVYYHCNHCNRSYTQPGSIGEMACPYCGSPETEHLAG